MSSIDLAYSSNTTEETLDLIKDLLIYLLEYEFIFRGIFF